MTKKKTQDPLARYKQCPGCDQDRRMMGPKCPVCYNDACRYRGMTGVLNAAQVSDRRAVSQDRSEYDALYDELGSVEAANAELDRREGRTR
jgi:hypothetical protein